MLVGHFGKKPPSWNLRKICECPPLFSNGLNHCPKMCMLRHQDNDSKWTRSRDIEKSQFRSAILENGRPMRPGANLWWLQWNHCPKMCMFRHQDNDSKWTRSRDIEKSQFRSAILENGRPMRPGLICDGSSGIIIPKCVCLDTKIMILSELEAEILKNLNFGRPFWKKPPSWILREISNASPS